MPDESTDLTWYEQTQTVSRAAQFHPSLAAGIILCSLFAAALEGLGLTFLLPILELA
jgi:subfamily B ATP-binding cassette protein MsbA